MRVGDVLEHGDVEVPPLTCGPVVAVWGVDAVLDDAVVGEGFGEALSRAFVFIGSKNADLVVSRVVLGNTSGRACWNGLNNDGGTGFLHLHGSTLDRPWNSGESLSNFGSAMPAFLQRRGRVLLVLALRAPVSAPWKNLG